MSDIKRLLVPADTRDAVRRERLWRERCGCSEDGVGEQPVLSVLKSGVLKIGRPVARNGERSQKCARPKRDSLAQKCIPD
jgi:hypothetical protein